MRVPNDEDDPETERTFNKKSEIESLADDKGIRNSGQRLDRYDNRRRQSENECRP